MNTQQNRLIDLLQAKRREDPAGFQKYLPGAAELLPELSPRRSRLRSPFGLTERERSHHQAGVSEVLDKLGEGEISTGDAAKGLQHCANLIMDDSLADEVDYEALKGLVRAAIGKSPSSYKSKTHRAAQRGQPRPCSGTSLGNQGSVPQSR